MSETTRWVAGKKQNLEPTLMERELVIALIDQRDNWPAIYLEMVKVSDEDLLSDIEFCQRHKRPSLTAFFVECGEIAGVNISTLRKYQRAGVYYESALGRHPELPPLVDDRVKNVPPDLLSLVSKINDLVRQSDSDIETLDKLEAQYILGILDGKITRMKLKNDLARFRSGLDGGSVEVSLLELENLNNSEKRKFSKRENIIANYALDKTTVDEWEKDKIRFCLSKGNWLRAFSAEKHRPRQRFTVYVAPGRSVCGATRYGRMRWQSFILFPDFVAVENVDYAPKIHALEILNCRDLESSRVVHRLNQQICYDGRGVKSEGTSSVGFDFFWLVLTSDLSSEKEIDEFGLAEEIGVMVPCSKGLSILRAPGKLKSDDKTRLALYQAFTIYLACLK